MKREKTFIVEIPKELESDFRLFVVLHGGCIKDVPSAEKAEDVDNLD